MAGQVDVRRQLPHVPGAGQAVRRLLHHKRHRPLYAVVPGQEEQRGRRFVPGLCSERQGGHETNSQQLLTLCTSALQDHPLAANDHFANWRLAASAAQNAALAGSTRAKRDSSWRRYECFLGRIGQLLEPFLGRLGRTQKVEVFASFAAALRGERLGAGQREGPRHGRKSGTICTTLDGVAPTFRLHQFESPIHDAAGRLEPVLALQLKGYADEDLDPRPQQALPLEVVRRVLAMRTTARDEAIGQLVVTAFFFAMRSCEYSDAGRGRITTVVTIDDVRFRKDGDTIPADDQELARLADTVSITFRRQKNRDNGTTITQHRNDRPGQADICPVRTLANLVARIRGHG